MNIKQFKEQLGKVYAFREECRKEAVEILKRNGGVVKMDISRMSFIDKGVYDIMNVCLDKNNDIQVIIESDGEHNQEVVGFDEATWDLVMLSDFMYSLYKADGQDEDETSEFDFVDEEHGILFRDTFDILDNGVSINGVSVYRKDSDGELHFMACIEDGISVADIEDMDETEFKDFLMEHNLI